MLGVSVELISCVIEANPVWKDDQQFVSERIKTTGCWVEKLSFLMLALFNFKKFTESRWLQQGPSNRNLSCALAVGLEQVVHITRADPTCSDYYVHGFSHCTVPVRKHAIICGLVAYVCEAVQSLLMVDDRVVRNIEQLEEALSTEMEFIHDIEVHVWERLNSIIGDPTFSVVALKSSVFDCCHIACCYTRQKFLDVCYDNSWKLASGDLSSNVDALRDEESGSGETQSGDEETN